MRNLFVLRNFLLHSLAFFIITATIVTITIFVRTGALPMLILPTPAPAISLTGRDNSPSSVSVPQPVVNNIRKLFEHGQALGNRPDVFSKVGDSITVSDAFLHAVGAGRYQLGNHGYLQSTIDYYSASNARAGNSFSNPSLAAGIGWSAWAVLSPEYAPASVCGVSESPLVCEYRTVKPSVALIMFGTNDAGYRTNQQFRADLERIHQISLQMGVIPVFSTIPNRPDVAQRVQEYNNIVYELAGANYLPVWDYNAAMQGLPNTGLTIDNVHPSTPPAGYNDTANFSVENLRYGYVIRNLTALQALYWVQQQVLT